MNEAEALELARRCTNKDPAQQLDGELQVFLARELEQVIPAGAETGIARHQGTPAALARTDSFLIVTTAARCSEGSLHLTSRAVSLRPTPQIELKSEIGVDRGTRRRTWTLCAAGAEPVALETSEVIYAQFSSDARPDSGELLMRTLGAKIEWLERAEG